MSGAALDMTLDDLIKNNKKSGGGGGNRSRGRASGPGPARRSNNRASNRAAPYSAAKVYFSPYISFLDHYVQLRWMCIFMLFICIIFHFIVFV